MTSAPHTSSSELAARLGTNVGVGVVVSSTVLSPTVREVVIGRAARFAGAPGNDVMVRLAATNATFVRRRYSVRSVNADADELTLWVTTAHEGAGCAWARDARAGDEVDLVGPRGKITLDPVADWHLFVGDTSALGAFYRLAQSIEIPGQAVFVVEIATGEDALTASFDKGLAVTGIFVDHQDRAANDEAGILRGLAALELPAGEAHAYLFGEFSVMKAAHVALFDRGLRDDQISRKAFWRAGRRNAEHGEPDKSEG